MKLELQRKVECQLTETKTNGILCGFLEQEPSPFEFENGFLFERYGGNPILLRWKNLILDLTNLQLVINDLSNLRYTTKDNLYSRQISAIIQKLYDQCIVTSVMNEGVTKDQAELIISESYDRGHHAGHSEVISYCFDYIDFVNKILGTINNK